MEPVPSMIAVFNKFNAVCCAMEGKSVVFFTDLPKDVAREELLLAMKAVESAGAHSTGFRSAEGLGFRSKSGVNRRNGRILIQSDDPLNHDHD